LGKPTPMKNYIKIISLIAIVIISKQDCLASVMEFGPYGVGFTCYETYDDSRTYFLGEDTISRPLLIHFWFPTKKEKTGDPLTFKDYIDLISQREDFGRSKSEIDNHSFYYVKGYSDFAKGQFGIDTSVSTQYLLNSPVYAKTGALVQNTGELFPLLIYAPSNSKASVQNHLLCEYLASHGFMIVSVASAGPNSIQRENMEESTMAQVLDMEYILRFCADSMKISYSTLGLFGFSSGGNAMTIFQMRNTHVGAVLSLDGGQEYSEYLKLYEMPDFDLSKADAPYLALVNNYEDFSIYPLYHSIVSREKYLYRLPQLNHNGFISYWKYFASCSPSTIKHMAITSFEYLSECAEIFFRRYLKSDKSALVCSFEKKIANQHIQVVKQDFSHVNNLYKALLDNDLKTAESLMEHHKDELFGGKNQVNILARMLSDNDMALWLYQSCVTYKPESWEAHYKLGNAYKGKGEILLAKKALFEAKKLSPENPAITELLNELNKMD